MTVETTLRVNGDRLWSSLMDLAKIGATPRGGVCRLALTEEDRRGRDWFKTRCEAMGLIVRADAVGNQFALLEGIESDLAPVMVGSHLDSQPSGGKFDGTYGVLAGLEIANVLREHNVVPRRSLEVVNWTNEEGSRFLPVMAGSGVFAGVHQIADVLTQIDIDGTSFGDALGRIDADGDHSGKDVVDAYFELHIEQGPILEAESKTIGVVTGALGQRWFNCTVTGFEAHAGPTPMGIRRDALQAAIAIIADVDRIGRIDPDARATVGMIDCWPNSRNTVPGRVTFSIDLRHAYDPGLDEMVARLMDVLANVKVSHKVGIEIVPTNDWLACQFDAGCVSLVRDAACASGHAWRDMVSGAGHDAVNIAKVAPTAMIFVPCRDGISHNEIEDATPSDLAAGADVLLAAVLARLNRTTD